MQNATLRWIGMAVWLLGLTGVACGAVFTWDGGGGAGNEGWAYLSGGKYVNWATDPATRPGSADGFTIAVPGLSVLDGDYALEGANCSVGASGGTATLSIPAGTTLSVGTNVSRILYIANAAAAKGSVVVRGTLLSGNGQIWIGGSYGDSEATMTVSGVVTNNGGAINIVNAAAESNALAVAGPRGTLNIHTGRFVQAATSADLFVANTVRSAGSHLASVGTIDLRDGTLLIASGRFLYLSQTNDAPTEAIVRGYGKIGKHGANAVVLRASGRVSVTADGDGANRDLDLTETAYATVRSQRENGVTESNGWYAIEKGRLAFPVSTTIGNKGSFVFGENTETTSDLDPDLVNSVVFTNILSAGGITIQGSLLAPDRDGLALPTTPDKTLAVWEFATGGGTISSIHAIFRYDSLRAAQQSIVEGSLLLWRNAGVGWVEVTGTQVDAGTKQMRAVIASVSPGSTLFAIGIYPPVRKGTTVLIR